MTRAARRAPLYWAIDVGNEISGSIPMPDTASSAAMSGSLVAEADVLGRLDAGTSAPAVTGFGGRPLRGHRKLFTTGFWGVQPTGAGCASGQMHAASIRQVCIFCTTCAVAAQIEYLLHTT